MKIITITLNPAFDVHCEIPDFKILKENYATSHSKCAGGKGINISRALSNFGIANTAYCVVGNLGGKEFLEAICNDGIDCKSICVEGSIRENITIHSNSGETRISFEGFSLTDKIFDDIFGMIYAELGSETIVTFTGRLCKGLSKASAIKFLSDIKNTDAKLIVDCNSFTLGDLTEIKPFLIKPNEQEITEIADIDIDNIDSVFQVARSIHKKGIENVMISLGENGFAFCGRDGEYKVDVPHIEPISTIGAGDSTIAGFMAGMHLKLNMCDCLGLSASFGTSACLTEGTNPPEKEVIYEINRKVKVEKYI